MSKIPKMLSFDEHQAKWLDKQPNASEAVRMLIDEKIKQEATPKFDIAKVIESEESELNANRIYEDTWKDERFERIRFDLEPQFGKRWWLYSEPEAVVEYAKRVREMMKNGSR